MSWVLSRPRSRPASSWSTDSSWPGRTVVGPAARALGPSLCKRALDRGHDHPRRSGKGGVVLAVGETPEQCETPAHRLDLRADALEGQRLPRRQYGDRPLDRSHDDRSPVGRSSRQQAGQVVGHPFRIDTRGGHHHDRRSLGEIGQGGDQDGLGRCGHGQRGVRRPEEGRQDRIAAEQPGGGAERAVVRPAQRRAGSQRGQRVSGALVTRSTLPARPSTPSGERMAPLHGGLDPVPGDVLDRVRRPLNGALEL